MNSELELTDEQAKVLMLWNLGKVGGPSPLGNYYYDGGDAVMVDVSNVILQLDHLGLVDSCLIGEGFRLDE